MGLLVNLKKAKSYLKLGKDPKIFPSLRQNYCCCCVVVVDDVPFGVVVVLVGEVVEVVLLPSVLVVVLVVSLGLQAVRPTANSAVANKTTVIRLDIFNSLSKLLLKKL